MGSPECFGCSGPVPASEAERIATDGEGKNEPLKNVSPDMSQDAQDAVNFNCGPDT